MKATIQRSALVLVAAAAAAIAGTAYNSSQSGDWRVCTDSVGRRILDAGCSGGSGGSVGGGGGGGWRYFRGSGSVPAIGEPASGGSLFASNAIGHSAAPSAGVSRGGFGGIGAAFGGHGGGGE